MKLTLCALHISSKLGVTPSTWTFDTNKRAYSHTLSLQLEAMATISRTLQPDRLANWPAGLCHSKQFHALISWVEKLAFCLLLLLQLEAMVRTKFDAVINTGLAKPKFSGELLDAWYGRKSGHALSWMPTNEKQGIARGDEEIIFPRCRPGSSLQGPLLWFSPPARNQLNCNNS